jgi:hypothetical protein
MSNPDHPVPMTFCGSDCTHRARTNYANAVRKRIKYFFDPYRERMKKRAIDQNYLLRVMRENA